MFSKLKAATQDSFGVVMAYLQNIVNLTTCCDHCCMILNILIFTSILPFKSKNIFIYLTQWFIRIAITTKNDCRITMNSSNLLILVSFERGECDLLFQDVVANQEDIQCKLFNVIHDNKLLIVSCLCMTFMHKRKRKTSKEEYVQIISRIIHANKDIDRDESIN